MKNESEGDFLRRGGTEKPKEAIVYEMAEMEADISVFTGDERPVVQKYLHQESLAPIEAGILRQARDRWFEEKYGFPYHDKAARREVIMRKYAPPEELAAAHELQGRMFAEFGNGTSPETMAKLKDEYSARYPDQLEGVELVLGMRHFLELSRKLGDPNQKMENPEERKDAYQDLTETHFLLTHFVLGNNKDKEFLELFWSSIEKIAASGGFLRELNLIRKGTVTQVATMRIFEELKMSPTLSHPRDDAFNNIDLWSDASHAVQIKSTGAENPEVVETDEICFPGTEVRHDGGVAHYNSKMFYDMQKFRAKVDRYGKLTNNPGLKGYFIVIPYAKVDFTTGEPESELVKTIASKIR